MLDLGHIRKLPSTMACEAATLAEPLSGAEVFLLMGMYEISKSDDLRILSIRQLDMKPAIYKPLAITGTSVKKVLKSLSARDAPKYILAAQGFRKLKTTPQGNCIKHGFYILREFLRSNGGLDPAKGYAVADVDVLRPFMRWVCESMSVDLSNLPPT